jgi:predicted AAA+ superfamily ATPase
MIKRTLQKTLEQKLGSNKALIILGARQTGKTTLLKAIYEDLEDALWMNADEPDIQAIFENSTSTRFKRLFADYKTVVLDEAQSILEERDGRLYAWEFKWNPKARVRLSKTFSRAYPDHEFTVVTPTNYHQFLLS